MPKREGQRVSPREHQGRPAMRGTGLVRDDFPGEQVEPLPLEIGQPRSIHRKNHLDLTARDSQ